MPETINLFVDECAAHGHAHERLSRGLVRRCVNGTDDDLGVLALAVGVMNMGVEIPVRVPNVDGGWFHAIDLPDPVCDGWRGRPTGHGKHLTDYRRGGLLGPHIDGSSLSEVYAQWGYPDVPPEIERDFGRIQRSEYADEWNRWAAELVSRREVLVWSVDWWLTEYWGHRLVSCAANREERVVRARIANSRPGWLRGAPDGLAELASMYIGRKAEEGKKIGKEAAKRERARRQMLYCSRVITLMRHFGRPSVTVRFE